MSLSIHSDLERAPVVPLPFGGVQGLAVLLTSCSFQLWLFFCAEGKLNLFPVPKQYPSPLQFKTSEVGVPFMIVSLSLLLFF